MVNLGKTDNYVAIIFTSLKIRRKKITYKDNNTNNQRQRKNYEVHKMKRNNLEEKEHPRFTDMQIFHVFTKYILF